MIQRETKLNENELEKFRESFINLPLKEMELVINEIKDHYIRELVKKYLLTTQDVRDEKDKSPETRRKNLKKLLEPIIWLNKLIHGKDNPYRINFPAWEGRPYNRSFYPFINEDIIDLDNEIDVSKLKKNPPKYHLYYNGNIINMLHDKISFPTRRESLLAEYYDKWILKITPETMRGNVDLLDNVLFIHAIKRALNGDKKTTEKLYSIYERMAEAEAIKIAEKWKIKKCYYDDIKSDAKFILQHIISGLRPEPLIADLQKEERDKTLLTPEWVENFYIWYYSEYLPPLLHEGVDLFEKNPDDFLLQQTIINFLSPYMTINTLTNWKSKDNTRIFNSESFRPTKKSNLTVWIFGTKKDPMLGKFRQLMNGILKRYVSEENLIYGQEFDENEDYFKKKDSEERDIIEKIDSKGTKIIDNEKTETNEMIGSLLEMINTSPRDAEIYIRHKVYKEKQAKIGKLFSLSREQINRIIREVDNKIKK